MPSSELSLAQMIVDRQKSLALTDRAVSEKYGWLQQTYNAWKHGRVPKETAFGGLSDFLGIGLQEIEDLATEARKSNEINKKPSAVNLTSFLAVQERGNVSDRKAGKFKFDAYRRGYGSIYVPEGRYSVQIDTNVMEPVLIFGARAWLDPAVWPRPGTDVIVHADKGAAWIGRLEAIDGTTARLLQYGRPVGVNVENFKAIHVIVLAERVVTAG